MSFEPEGLLEQPSSTPNAARGDQVSSYAEGSTSPRLYCEDNQFNIPGDRADPSAAGDFFSQATDAAWTGSHTASAALAKATNGALPFEQLVRVELKALEPTPPVANEKAEEVEYKSHIAHVPPNQAFQYAVEHPAELFASAGITVRPAVGKLEDGTRLFLEEPGLNPPVWAPIEVRLMPESQQLAITTLQGHPLRGINSFSFESDGEGGTNVTQRSTFQMSSKLVEAGASAMKAMGNDSIDRQHDIWRAVHAHLADYSPTAME